MSDLVSPGEAGSAIDNRSTGHAIEKAGSGAWIVSGSDIADNYASLDETGLAAFGHASSTGLDVVIEPGEAYISGWLCRDRQTTVSLPASSTTTIYVGWDVSAVLGDTESPPDHENVIIGAVGAFDGEDPRTPIWEFTTDGSSVTGSTDLRQTLQPVEFKPVNDEIRMNADVYIDGDLTGIDLADALSEIAIDVNKDWDGFNITNVGDLDVSGFGEFANQVDLRGGFSAFGAGWMNGREVRDLNESGHNAVSSADATKLYVSSTQPSDTDPHLWFIPE